MSANTSTNKNVIIQLESEELCDLKMCVCVGGGGISEFQHKKKTKVNASLKWRQEHKHVC